MSKLKLTDKGNFKFTLTLEELLVVTKFLSTVQLGASDDAYGLGVVNLIKAVEEYDPGLFTEADTAVNLRIVVEKDDSKLIDLDADDVCFEVSDAVMAERAQQPKSFEAWLAEQDED